MTEHQTSAAITFVIVLPVAALLAALVLPRLTSEYKAGVHVCWAE